MLTLVKSKPNNRLF